MFDKIVRISLKKDKEEIKIFYVCGSLFSVNRVVNKVMRKIHPTPNDFIKAFKNSSVLYIGEVLEENQIDYTEIVDLKLRKIISEYSQGGVIYEKK